MRLRRMGYPRWEVRYVKDSVSVFDHRRAENGAYGVVLNGSVVMGGETPITDCATPKGIASTRMCARITAKYMLRKAVQMMAG